MSPDRTKDLLQGLVDLGSTKKLYTVEVDFIDIAKRNNLKYEELSKFHYTEGHPNRTSKISESRPIECFTKMSCLSNLEIRACLHGGRMPRLTELLGEG